jgi:hypothetical protein
VPSTAQARGCLVTDGWDDFGFKTSFNLIVFDEASIKHEIGYVKIGRFGMGKKKIELPESFKQLGDTYFSLGKMTAITRLSAS